MLNYVLLLDYKILKAIDLFELYRQLSAMVFSYQNLDILKKHIIF